MNTTNVTNESSVLNLYRGVSRAPGALVLDGTASRQLLCSAGGLTVAVSSTEGLDVRIEPLVESLGIEDFDSDLVDDASMRRAEEDVAGERTVKLEELARELEDRVRSRGRGQD